MKRLVPLSVLLSTMGVHTVSDDRARSLQGEANQPVQ
jgi:hypothetical protein